MYDAHEVRLFLLLVDLYKSMEEWEELEDFCLNPYYENEYIPVIYPSLHFTHFKRQSDNKAKICFMNL